MRRLSVRCFVRRSPKAPHIESDYAPLLGLVSSRLEPECSHLPVWNLMRNAFMNATELNRLRWRCRRGMLENDLILARYLDARGEAMSAAELSALDRLLDLADGELWDLIAGKTEPADTGLLHVVAQLRSA